MRGSVGLRLWAVVVRPMPMTPQISIITPCLNQAPFVSQTLASVAAQNGVAHEHLIFDPGSFDGSRALIRAHAAAHANVRPFFEPTAGPADAINRGIARSQSKFIGWLGADDVYAADDVLARMSAALRERADIDVVYARSTFIGANGDALDRLAPFQAAPAHLGATMREGEAFVASAALCRRDLFERVGPLSDGAGLAYDYDFWLRVAASGAKFAPLDLTVVRKRVRLESASRLLGGARAMACARATRSCLGQASPNWIARAVDADIMEPGGPSAQTRGEAAANVWAAVRRGFSDVRQEETLVLLGNGPSLRGFDFAQLRGMDTLGMNAAYRYWREIGWYPRYYACLDTVVGMSHRDDIEAMVVDAGRLGIDLFLLRESLIRTFSPAARRSLHVVDFDAIAGAGGLLDISSVTTGSHAALFGALLGYQTLLLMGVDGNYVEIVEGAEVREGTVLELTSQPAHNPNYFFEGYQAPGDRYNVPNAVPDLHLQCWRDVGARLAARGVAIWNGSVTSKVDAFPHRQFERFRDVVAARPVASA